LILVWGDDDDPPVARILAELERRRVGVVHVGCDLGALEYDVTLGPHPTGKLRWSGEELPVEEIRGIYLRPGEPPTGHVLAAAAMSALASFVCAPVVNRPVAGRSNWSKPFQSQLLARAGFAIPDTLLTTDPTAAADFIARHDRVVYKSISGVRSIVALVDRHHPDRLEDVRSGPVQFQRWIDGTDVRVHVVGDRVFATAVESADIDYRYPAGEGGLSMAPVEIPDPIAQRLVAFAREQGLLLAGADLRVTPDGEWYAFEVNPSPGFSFYEDTTGQPIAAAIADLLCPC
jgi:glutathione synthase/RimK-type ligase-like ATP-grasp enzyme